ncbi:hypothetical protein CH92_14005 [Stutzerimonas stutzeri]|uniref:DNA repair protein n=1 Tax=Stutzerimonas stutzeri TaxID=316 RepID=W8QZV8_STUST|nr:hypothetical protein [Stutzerimonas stutzeri]AHL76145.1 hypothetical protein CH92_14005 [Stutzerimonas stutzeri]MCQ4329366.1 hypothetical protein [Stutzerimonas stutzeri]
MSPVLIAGLVIAGLFVLTAIGVINQIVEKNNLEKARLRAELTDRMRRCANLSESFPGQMMTPALKLLLTRLELHLGERLLPLDKKNAAVSARVDSLRGAVAQGEEIPLQNAPVKVVTEAQAKEIRLLLEDLHAQIIWANKQNQLDTAAAKRWMQQIQRMMVMLHIEYFSNLGQQALQQGSAHKARLAFERGIQHVRKQPNPVDYQAQLAQLEASYAHANKLEQTQQQPKLDDPSELTDGLKNLESEDDWKKNNIY